MSSPRVEFIPGPPTSEVTRSVAETGLRRHPAIRKGAKYALEQMEGRWVAAVVHEAAPPFGAPADEDEEAPGPKSEGPDDTAPAPDEEPPADDGSEGPPKDDDKGEKGGKDQLLHQIMDALTQLGAALGVPIGIDTPVPGPDGPPGAGGPPPGPPGPPGAGGPPAPDKLVHERALKPGETPPGGTPLGSPAFASVRADHPWAHLAGKVASFKVSDEIGDAPMQEVVSELNSLAAEIGYKAVVREGRADDGKRIASALITSH